MASGLPRVLTFVCAIGAGVVAGVFFAFSTFVMQGLRRVPASSGLAAMQGINLAAPTPVFMAALLGTGLGCGALIVVAVTQWGDPGAPWALVGSVAYLVSIVLTITYHVPRNDALAGVDVEAADAAERWRRYLAEWVPWNHARTVTCLVAAVLLTIALLRAEP
jgi:uncharacterized membrane protein